MATTKIKKKMIKSRYSFINFDRKKQVQLFNELIIANNKNLHRKSIHLTMEIDPYEEDMGLVTNQMWQEMESKCKKLQEILKKNDIEF